MCNANINVRVERGLHDQRLLDIVGHYHKVAIQPLSIIRDGGLAPSVAIIPWRFVYAWAIGSLWRCSYVCTSRSRIVYAGLAQK